MADSLIKGLGGGTPELIDSTGQSLHVYITGGSGSGGSVPVTPTKGTLTDRSGILAAANVAQTIANANANRKYFIFENQSSGNLWINFTATAVEDEPSIMIVPTGSMVMEAGFISTEAISVIGATMGQAWSAKEA